MTGRADKAIVITTGSFTAEARKEAIRDGAPPIELVDGEKLITMLGTWSEAGTTFEVDEDFFGTKNPSRPRRAGAISSSNPQALKDPLRGVE